MSDEMKTVAAVSFRDNRSISLDMEDVTSIDLGQPMQLAEDQWFCELIVRSANGFVALQLMADDPEKFQVHQQEEGLGEEGAG